MSFLHRTPRQVYRVFGEEEYLTEEREAANTEYFHGTDSGSRNDRSEIDRPSTEAPEVGAAAPLSGSRTPRLVGIGLLLGVTAGAAGLVFSHLTHEASSTRGSSPAPRVSHRVSSTRSGPFPHRVAGEVSAYPKTEPSTRDKSTKGRSRSGYSPRRFAIHRDTFGSGFTVREPIEAGRWVSAQTAGPNWVWRVVASMNTKAQASTAASGGEFEFERGAP